MDGGIKGFVDIRVLLEFFDSIKQQLINTVVPDYFGQRRPMVFATRLTREKLSIVA